MAGITKSYACRQCVRDVAKRQRAKRDKEAHRAYKRSYDKRYRQQSDSMREYFTSYYHKLKATFISEYGGKCQGPTGTGDCIHGGVTDPDLLTIAHMNFDGKAHRQKVGNAVILDLRKRGWPKDEGISIQCFNCNWKHRLTKLNRKRIEPCE